METNKRRRSAGGALRSAIVDALATGAATIDDLSEPDTGEHTRKVKK